MIIYETDGSFEGLLTAVFEKYIRKHESVFLTDSLHIHPQIFEEVCIINTDVERVKRVWVGLEKRLSHSQLRAIFVAYLSEIPAVINDLFFVICQVFDEGASTLENYGDTRILLVQQTIRRVEREKHRMMAFVRFRKSVDGLYHALIEPDFDVLPLIGKFFRERYADQQWLIYDVRRKYGYFYNKVEIEEVVLDKLPTTNVPATITLNDEGHKYSILWRDYYHYTNISVRKNTKLHLRHVPKRYWKYLTEKMID